jgi:hypothetical protein
MNISAQTEALPDEDAETLDKRICAACVREAYLNGVIIKEGEEAVCHGKGIVPGGIGPSSQY